MAPLEESLRATVIDDRAEITTSTQPKIVAMTPALRLGALGIRQGLANTVERTFSPDLLTSVTRTTPTRTITPQQPWAATPADDSSVLPDEAPLTTFLASATCVGSGRVQLDASKAFTTVNVTTMIVTGGTLTMAATRTLPVAEIQATSIVTMATRTFTMTTEVATQMGTVSSSTGPPKATIGGVLAGTVMVAILIFIFFYLRAKRRRTRQVNTAAPASTLVHPFLSGTFAQHSPHPAEQQLGERVTLPDLPHSAWPELGSDSDNGSTEDLDDPFRDPEAPADANLPESRVQGSRTTLDHIQKLTVQLDAELGRLGDLARSGQLSDTDRTRLDEIRHIISDIPPDLRPGRVLSGLSVATANTSPPPSYEE